MTQLRYGFWDFSIPNQWISSTPSLESFILRNTSVSALNLGDNKVVNFLGLLESTGCLTAKEKDDYSLAEVSTLVERIVIGWHGIYYSHPIWNRLRSGEMGKNGFVAWVLHNYHLSRSAGATAARGAVHSPDERIRRIFLESALEEYSHCEDYYCIRDSRLGVSEVECQRYIALPSSLAIDQQMHRLAETDWIGHVIVAFFQESTASYFKKCCDFYEEVERRYDLQGFFDTWKQHILLDLKYGHASAFLEAFAPPETLRISRESLSRSVSGAAIAVHYLLGALDEIISEDVRSSEIVLRNHPCPQTPFDSFLRGYQFDSSFENTRDESLAEAVGRTILTSEPITTYSSWDQDERRFLITEIASAILKSLSCSQSHADVVFFGGLLEGMKQEAERCVEQHQKVCSSPRAVALANFMRETSSNPARLAGALQLLVMILGGDESIPWRKVLEYRVDGGIATSEILDGICLHAQLSELAAFPNSTSISSEL